MALPPAVPSPDPVEAQAQADLAGGRWRKARDAYKELCKRDRGTFLPWLIEANVGLARSMLDKRLISDARQVLAYLKTIASPEITTALESEIATRVSGASKSAMPPDPLALLAEGALSMNDQRRVADQLVVAFKDVEAHAAVSARQAVAKDLRAIHASLEAVCLGDHDRALELVRPIDRDSAFAHWRLFVRAVAAFQRNDPDKAARYFEALPSDSVPGRARAAWLLALGRRGAAPLATESEAELEAAGALMGESGWGRVLARAESLWRAGKHASSYRAVREAKTSFPSEGLDFSSVLTSFYFNSVFAVSGDRLDAYANALWEIEESRRSKSLTELTLIRRTLCLRMTFPGDDFGSAEVRTLWEGFLHGHERLHGSNPRLASAAWRWLGEVLARPRSLPAFGGRAPQAIDSKAAIEALKKSITLDPANAEAHLTLAAVYKTAKRVGDLNRLLDLMASRFPGNKQVLLAAGVGSLEHKAYGKAVEHFERALALDRLDPSTPDSLATACLRLAHQHYKKGRPMNARQALDRAAELAVDLPDNFVRRRWCMSARRGVLESLYGDARLGEALLNELRAASASPVQFLFFAWMAWSFYDDGRPFPRSHQIELDRAVKAQPNTRDAAVLMQIWRYWANDSGHAADASTAWLRRYLRAAVRTPFTRDDAARLLALAHRIPAFGAESRGFTSKVLEQDPSDPLFRLYVELLEPFPMLDRANQDAILAEARRRGDTAAEQLCHEIVGELGMMGTPLMELPTDERRRIDDDFDDFPGFPPGFGDSPEETATSKLLRLIAGTRDSEIAALKKKRPKGMPAMLFDLLVLVARGGVENPLTPHGGKPQGGRSRPRKKRQGKPVAEKRSAAEAPEEPAPPPRAAAPKTTVVAPDPNQPDLF